ncbi:MAG TPA: diguanylate cyclase [Candidatus Acidoferrales bacterium]|nr:diguanylate cyclase [Candidatus Acidoferrales bacterium]
MRAAVADLRLDVLTQLGHRLPRTRSPEEAATEVVTALAALEVAAIVSAVESDIAVVAAMHSPPALNLRLSPQMAASVVGMRLPLDGVESLRQPVRLRKLYYGSADAAATLRRLTTDSALAKALPNAADERSVLAVPVTCRDRVVAVLSVWGPGCTPALGPILEVVAAMLAAAWSTEAQPATGRFDAQPSATPDTELRGIIDSLLCGGGIVSALQPIVRLVNETVIGYEALARYPPLPRIRTPDELFASAASLNMQSAVDLACVSAALHAASNIGDADLFVNVLIGTLVDQRGVAALDKAVHDARVDPASIVLEFSEREPVPDLALLQRIAAELRARGFRIAVDDAGAGHASMRVIAELRPEFIKVDRSLIQAVDADRARRALVVALLSFSGHIGARVIAEGIETVRERETLQSLGVQFGQGWLIGRPVLMHSLDGNTEEVVDPTWFARRPVSPTRVALNDAPEAEPLPAHPMRSNPGKRGLARALSDAALALQSEHDPMRILGVMADQMSRVVQVTEMAIFVADYETFRLVPVLATGVDADEILADSMSLDAGITGWAFAKGTPQNIPDTSKHPLARQIPGTAYVEESLLLVPLVATEHKLGIINCWRLGIGQFSDRELEAASLFAHVAASAWRNAQLYVELVNAAMTDPLTRLYNSRWLRDTGERDLARAERNGKPLSLLLVDLDHFKAVNDSSGHAIGDLLLQRVATQLRTTVRGADAVVRLGGEEFVILLPECDADAALQVAEAVRAAVRDVTVPEGCSLDQLTASVGVATYPDHGRGLDQLLGAADRAMYAAKHEGRDRSVRALPLIESRKIITLPRRRTPRTPTKIVSGS